MAAIVVNSQQQLSPEAKTPEILVTSAFVNLHCSIYILEVCEFAVFIFGILFIGIYLGPFQ